MTSKFFVFPRVRRSEFRFGIVNSEGREIANIEDEAAARKIVEIMNSNAELDAEKIARLQQATIGEGYRMHIKAALRARRYV